MIAIWEALYREEALSTGRTRPLVVSCELESSARTERGVFVVKIPGLPEVTADLCCRELLGCLLAKALGVRVPEPALISVSPAFVEATRNELEALGLSISPGLAFGCRRLVSLANVTALTTNVPERLDEAARIYAVDMLLQNHDRTTRNPNCAVSPEGLVAFDFEQSFGFLYLIGDQPKPWEISKMKDLPRKHLFWAVLRRQSVQWRAVVDVGAVLSDGVLEQIAAAVPANWSCSMNCSGVIDHIKEVRSRIDDFCHELNASLV